MTDSFKELDKQYVAGTYNRFPVELVSGKGAILTAIDGKEYIDMGSGIGVNSFGCIDDVWSDAVKAQLGKLQHTSNLYYTQPCVQLAKMLCERTGMSKVFFCNSGAEANECAIKVARKYASDKKGAGHHTIITLQNSFHGRTLTTLAATGQDHYHELFQPLTPGFVSTPPNDIAALEKCVMENSPAAIMIECIQGEGGVCVLQKDFVKAAEKLARENDLVLIVDEVQTGNGRTGKLYSYMNFDIVPDVVSTAKGLGGGLPLGAAMLAEKVQGVLGFGDHGSTFGGNPICCAGAISILSRLTDEFLEDVAQKGRFVFDTLGKAEGVEAMSGLGLMIGIKPVKAAGDVVKACMENGVLCLTAKDKVRLLPPLNIPMDVLEKAVGVIRDALK